VTEFLDDIFILEELGLTPIWLEKKTEENKSPHFLAYRFDLKEIKIFFLASFDELKEEEVLFNNIVNYIHGFSNHNIKKVNKIALNELKQEMITVQPDYLFLFGGISQNHFSDMDPQPQFQSSEITLADMIMDTQKKKILWHDMQTFLNSINSN
jgi:hypothetical protein